MSTTRFLILAGAATLCGCGSKGSEPECAFPAAPAGAAAIRYVCPGASGDGSSPSSAFATIHGALAVVSDGTVLLLGAGSYAENVAIARPVSLVGSGDARAPGQAAAEIRAPASHAVVVTGRGGILLQGLQVSSPSGSGIWLDAGEATVTGCTVAGSSGYGVLGTGGARLSLRSSVVSGSARVGVGLAGGSTGIIDDNGIRGNAGGGIRVDDLGSAGAVQILRNKIDANRDFGVGIFSANAIIDDNGISANLSGSASADGVLVTSYDGKPPSHVTLRGNAISDNGRVGVMFGAGALGIIDDNGIRGNGSDGSLRQGAGIWLQGGAGATEGVKITRNTLDANRFAGIGLFTGAFGIIDDNGIRATAQSQVKAVGMSVDVGDGVAILDGARAVVKNNQIAKCFRAGVFSNNADGAKTSVTGNTIANNDFAMLLQSQSSLASSGGNTMTGNSSSDAIVNVPAGSYATLDKPFAVPAPAEPPK